MASRWRSGPIAAEIGRFVTSEVPIGSGTMTGGIMVGAAHDGPILHHASKPGQVFADANSRNIG